MAATKKDVVWFLFGLMYGFLMSPWAAALAAEAIEHKSSPPFHAQKIPGRGLHGG